MHTNLADKEKRKRISSPPCRPSMQAPDHAAAVGTTDAQKGPTSTPTARPPQGLVLASAANMTPPKEELPRPQVRGLPTSMGPVTDEAPWQVAAHHRTGRSQPRRIQRGNDPQKADLGPYNMGLSLFQGTQVVNHGHEQKHGERKERRRGGENKGKQRRRLRCCLPCCLPNFRRWRRQGALAEVGWTGRWGIRPCRPAGMTQVPPCCISGIRCVSLIWILFRLRK